MRAAIVSPCGQHGIERAETAIGERDFVIALRLLVQISRRNLIGRRDLDEGKQPLPGLHEVIHAQSAVQLVAGVMRPAMQRRAHVLSVAGENQAAIVRRGPDRCKALVSPTSTVESMNHRPLLVSSACAQGATPVVPSGLAIRQAFWSSRWKDHVIARLVQRSRVTYYRIPNSACPFCRILAQRGEAAPARTGRRRARDNARNRLDCSRIRH